MQLYLLGAVLLAAAAVQGQDPPTPVDTLDVMKWVGNWYQIGTNNNVLNSVQQGSTCAVWQYGKINGNSISVDMRYRMNAPDGELKRMVGTATMLDTSKPGIHHVKFDDAEDAMDWYVIKLGPENSMRYYKYAVMTDTNKAALFIIARDVEDFLANDKDSVMAYLDGEGFNTEQNKPVLTLQSDECQYPAAFMHPTPVSKLEIDPYMQKWFMVYNNKNTNDRSTPDSYCATVEYNKLTEKTLEVLNKCRTGSPTGEANTRGTGTGTLTNETGVLAIEFKNIPGKWDYRVIKLGPMVDGLYDYAVNTDINKFSFYILARDVKRFEDEYKDDLLQFAEEQGFDGITNSPLKQYHGPDCTYPPGFSDTTGDAGRPYVSVLTVMTLMVAAWMSTQ